MDKSSKILGFFYILLFSLVFSSCNNSPDETSNRDYVPKDTAVQLQKPDLKGYSPDFTNLVISPEGVFRGIRLGLSKDSIKSIENRYGNSELQEDTPTQLDYMVNFGSFENTELTYKLNERGSLEGIEVFVYPKSKGSQDSIYLEFKKYFSELYGESKEINPGTLRWEKKNQDIFVQMQKRDTQKVHDINIIISYLTRQSAGMLYDPLPEGL